MALNGSSTLTLTSNIAIPRLGFGVYKSASTYDTVTTALESGYKHFDSARLYENEEAVCKAVADSGLGGKVFLTTKVQGKEQGSAEETAKAVDESVAIAKAHGLQWDLFLLHDPTAGPGKRVDAWKVLIEKKKAGVLKAIGVSNFGVKHLEELAAAGLETPDVNQLEVHPWCQQKDIVAYCNAHGIAIEAYCPLVRGTTLDNATLVAVAKKHSKSGAQILVKWSLQKGFIPLPKSDTPSRIKDNIDVFDFELDTEDLTALDALDKDAAGACSWNPVLID